MEATIEKLKKEWDAEAAKLMTLRVDLKAVQRKISDITSQVAEQNCKKSKITQAAEALLSGDKEPLNRADLMVSLDSLYERLRLLSEAIRIQDGRVLSAEHNYTKAVGETRRGEYATIIRENVAAVVSLAKAIEKEQTFRDSFKDAGLSFTVALGNPCNFSKVGTLSDENSRATFYIRTVAESGLISEKEIKKLVAV